MRYRVSNLKLWFLFGLLWRYGKCYDFGLLVCYTIDLRQFFGAKKPDRKWPEMTKNDLSCKNSILDWFWTFIWSCIFGFLENATSIFQSRYTWDFFLVCTGCGSAIYNTQFHFRTLYIPKNHSDMEKIGHFRKSKKKFFQKKFSKKFCKKNFFDQIFLGFGKFYVFEL